MNKLAQYLNQHLVGEVATSDALRTHYATDGSVLTAVPEMVAYPYNTSDIRKVMTFTLQLAEKGHVLPVTVRGAGTDTTGAAIGSGALLVLDKHMTNIFEYDAKQKLVRMQPGVKVGALQSALMLQGTRVTTLDVVNNDATVGGALAGGVLTEEVVDWVDQLEVVLANGDVLQTKRLSKRELVKKKALESKEGEIYRELDNLIEDNQDIIQGKLGMINGIGYTSIIDVKHKDGSFDLTPLFIGSQGTLGIVSEMILKAEYVADTRSVVVAAFADEYKARDVVDEIDHLGNVNVTFYSAQAVHQAQKMGKKYPIVDAANSDDVAVVVATVHDLSARAQARKVKRIVHACEQYEGVVSSSTDARAGEFANIESIGAMTEQPALKNDARMPILEGMYVSLDRFDEFMAGTAELEKKHGIALALVGRPIEGTWTVRPELSLKTVAGKQLLLKLIDDFAILVAKCGGTVAGQNGEGRLHSFSARRTLDPELVALFDAIRAIFDPHGTLNKGVKQAVDIHDLAKQLRSELPWK